MAFTYANEWTDISRINKKTLFRVFLFEINSAKLSFFGKTPKAREERKLWNSIALREAEIKAFDEEIDWVRKLLGDNYLEKLLEKVGDAENEIIIAIENQNYDS